MAGRLGTVQGLVLGLVFVAFGVGMLPTASDAEPWRERRARTAQGAPVYIPPAQKRLQARPVRAQETSCGFPWTYSRGSRSCVCTRDGYSLQRGKCVRDGATASCRDNERWSPKRGACVCVKGLKREGGLCVPIEPVAAQESDAAETPPASAAPSPEEVEAIARAQRCLAELGYYKGTVDGKRGKETWTAYWHFKQQHGLRGYSDLLAEPVQEKFASLCKASEETATIDPLAPDPLAPDQPAGDPPAADQPETNEAADSPEVNTEAEIALVAPDEGEDAVDDALKDSAGAEPKPRLDLDCLPEDLLALLRRAHGPDIAVNACERACLPPPKGMTQSQLDGLQTANGLVWCRACVPIDGRLALDDVRRIEREGRVQICATPPPQLQRYGEGVADGLRSYMRVRALYRALPPAEEDPEAVAVVIGNRSYDKLPRSVTSYNDADAVYAFLTEHLGYRPDNIIDLRDAKKADLEKVFGAEPGFEGDLARLVQTQANAKVLVYYSGHGATDGAQNETYLLPVDTERYREERDGYKMSTLYANLARLDAKSVLVLLEAEYGGDHGPDVLSPNLPETLKSALPRAPVPALTVLSASDRGQRTLLDLTYDIGLFTRYVIEGLAGSADLAPIGNGDGEVDSAELYVFAATMVELAARKSYGLLQEPVYSGAATSVLTSARTLPAGTN
jgi:hypothetical protein